MYVQGPTHFRHRLSARGLFAGAVALTLLAGCDGPHEEAGKQADKAARVRLSIFSKGPQQRLGALQDRTDRDRAKAVAARADMVEDQAKTIRAAADSQADALDRQAGQIRAQGKAATESRKQQTDKTISK